MTVAEEGLRQSAGAQTENRKPGTENPTSCTLYRSRPDDLVSCCSHEDASLRSAWRWQRKGSGNPPEPKLKTEDRELKALVIHRRRRRRGRRRLRDVRHQRLRSQHHGGDAGGVLERRARHLRRVDDACLEQVDVLVVAR